MIQKRLNDTPLNINNSYDCRFPSQHSFHSQSIYRVGIYVEVLNVGVMVHLALEIAEKKAGLGLEFPFGILGKMFRGMEKERDENVWRSRRLAIEVETGRRSRWLVTYGDEVTEC